MKKLLIDIQNRLQVLVTNLKYIDEDWGQLDYYNVAQPVKYPCALINLGNVNSSNQGGAGQQRLTTITITVCDIKLSNTSSNAPQLQKQAAWKVYDTIEAVDDALHGWAGSLHYSKLSLLTINRRKNDEGLNLFDMIYTTNIQKTRAVITMVSATPEVSVQRL